MKKYQRGGKLPKAQKGPVPFKSYKKIVDNVRRGPGILPPDVIRPNKGKIKKKYVKGSGLGPVPVGADIDSFRKKAKSVRDKMQKGGSLKNVPSGKKFNGLRSLPTEVRNKMGYAKYGMKMMKGGSLRRSMKHK